MGWMRRSLAVRLYIFGACTPLVVFADYYTQAEFDINLIVSTALSTARTGWSTAGKTVVHHAHSNDYGGGECVSVCSVEVTYLGRLWSDCISIKRLISGW